jgi:hypothetical protein
MNEVREMIKDYPYLGSFKPRLSIISQAVEDVQ